jgi:hypothetical protein
LTGLADRIAVDVADGDPETSILLVAGSGRKDARRFQVRGKSRNRGDATFSAGAQPPGEGEPFGGPDRRVRRVGKGPW